MTSTPATGLDADVLARVEQVARACAEADGAQPFDEATWRALRHRPATDLGWWSAEDAVALLVDGELGLAVDPAARGRGRGRDLLEEVLAVADGEPLRAWSHADHPAARVLADAHGFDVVRELWVMRRPTGKPLPPVVLPDGVRVDTWTDADADELVAVNAAAFAAHPEQGAMDREDLAERMEQDWFDPAGLFLARDTATGELLGFHWTKRTSERLGEVYVLGISPAAQGRGLGTVLTLVGLHHLVDGGPTGRGVDEAELYVEADNDAAVAVYARHGFTHAGVDTHVMYARGPSS
ncbi:mycothiol synthase [Nocardioides sp. CFH 31398]|uniref:mycothiol synthase n=1 Tax=Nocardioides sp. CFH 31398 TaxID=2919579 RepID=UPI001F057DC4|nr:mycothiol synthase [Nocardioides sp. CFH 31398]MCH1866028.1 mycothiol synthase [Nocardioides sp. CFH 31398]